MILSSVFPETKEPPKLTKMEPIEDKFDRFLEKHVADYPLLSLLWLDRSRIDTQQRHKPTNGQYFIPRNATVGADMDALCREVEWNMIWGLAKECSYDGIARQAKYIVHSLDPMAIPGKCKEILQENAIRSDGSIMLCEREYINQVMSIKYNFFEEYEEGKRINSIEGVEIVVDEALSDPHDDQGGRLFPGKHHALFFRKENPPFSLISGIAPLSIVANEKEYLVLHAHLVVKKPEQICLVANMEYGNV